MLSALFWLLLFIAVVVAGMAFREHVRSDKGIHEWYESVVKDRLGLLKKIVVYGTLIPAIRLFSSRRDNVPWFSIP